MSSTLPVGSKPGRSPAPCVPTETIDVGIPTGTEVPQCIINAVFREEKQGFVFPSPEASERDDQQIYRAGFTKPSTGLSIVPCQLEKNKLHRCGKNLSENLFAFCGCGKSSMQKKLLREGAHTILHG